MTVNITWMGHAAFLVETDGLRILLDPFDAARTGTYAPISVDADAVFVSHENAKYHSFWPAARGNPLHVNGLDLAGDKSVSVGSAVLRAVQVYESPTRDVPVSMPCLNIGGLNICHSGDLGHALSDTEIEAVGACDIFLAVAGGPPTLLLLDLKEVIARIKPRVVIPMHFGNGKINLPLQSVDDFLALWNPTQVIFAPSATWPVSQETLPAQMTVVVLPSLL